MRESGAKVVTSMLDVQLKIIWKFEWKRIIIHSTKLEKTDLIDSLILPTTLACSASRQGQFNYILGECKSSQSNKMALHSIPDS